MGVIVGADVGVWGAVDGANVAVDVSVGVAFAVSMSEAGESSVPRTFELGPQPARVRVIITKARVIFLTFISPGVYPIIQRHG